MVADIASFLQRMTIAIVVCLIAPESSHAVENSRFCVVSIETPQDSCRSNYFYSFKKSPAVLALPLRDCAKPMRLQGNRFVATDKEDFPNNFIHDIFVETPDGEVLGFADQLYEDTRLLLLDKKTSVFHRLDVPGIEKLGTFANDPRKSNVIGGRLPVERLGGLIITTKLTGSFLYKAGELKPYVPLNNIKTGRLAGLVDMPQLNAIVALTQEPLALNIVFDDGRVISTDDFGLERGDFHAIRITENRILLFIYGSTRGEVLTKLIGRGPNTMYRYLIEVDPTPGLADPFRFSDYMVIPIYPQVGGEYDHASYPIASEPQRANKQLRPLKDQLGALFIKSRNVYLLQKSDGIYYDDGEGIGSKIEGSEKILLIRVNDLPSLDLVLLDGGKYELTKDMRIVPLKALQDMKGLPLLHIVEMPISKVAVVFAKDGAYALDAQRNVSLISGSKKTIGSGAYLSSADTKLIPEREEVFVLMEGRGGGLYMIADKKISGSSACDQVFEK